MLLTNGTVLKVLEMPLFVDCWALLAPPALLALSGVMALHDPMAFARSIGQPSEAYPMAFAAGAEDPIPDPQTRLEAVAGIDSYQSGLASSEDAWVVHMAFAGMVQRVPPIACWWGNPYSRKKTRLRLGKVFVEVSSLVEQNMTLEGPRDLLQV
jgi:hypothetical protein